MIPLRGLLVPAAALAVFLFLSQAAAHVAPAGWTYDPACCSGNDCQEMPDGSIEERADGYLIKSTGELIPREKARYGQDEHYHLCRQVAIYCLYLPLNSS